jgi:hypothetical protein
MESVQAAQGDIHTWTRNWHENVILEGIEAQRKNVSVIAQHHCHAASRHSEQPN